MSMHRVWCSLLCVTATAITIAACHCQAQSPLVRPSVVTFALLTDMVDDMFQFDGTQTYAGMKAAEKEVNDNDLIGGGTKLNIEFIAAPSLAATQADTISAIQNATQGRFGLIMPDWSTSRYVASVIQSNYNSSIPVVAPRLLTTAELLNQNRFSLNLRQPPAVEYLPMLVYAMGSAESRCTAFVILSRSLFDVSNISVGLELLGYPAALVIDLPPPIDVTSLTFDPAGVLDTWAASNAELGYFIPPCALMFILPSDAMTILDAMYTDSRFNMSQMTFFASALTSESAWNTTTHGTAPFSRVRFVTNFVDPSSTTLPLAVQYRSALRAYLSSLNTSTLPVEFLIKPMLSTPTYPALEGYLAVRWAASILARMSSITPKLFIDAMYSSHLSFVDGVALGPFTDACVAPNTLNLPCFCNVGSSTLEIGAINLTTGIACSKSFDAAEYLVGHQTLSLDQCYLQTESMRAPLLIAMWTAWNPTGTTATIYSAFVTLIRQLSVVYNDAGTLPSCLISAVKMNDIMPYLPNESNTVYFRRVYATRRPVFIIGAEFQNVSAKIVNVVVPSTVVLEDPPLSTANNFTRYTWNLEVVFADLAHAMSSYVADTYRTRSPRVIVISDEDAVQNLALKSLHTFQVDPELPGERDLTTFASVNSLVQDAAATAAAGKLTILMVASRNAAVFVVALTAVAMIPAAADPNSVFSRNFVVVIPASPEFLFGATLAVNATALRNIPILFPSAYMPFWEPTNAFRLRAASLLGTTSPLLLSVSSLYIAIVMFDLFTNLVETTAEQFPTAEGIVNAMYKMGTVTINGVVLGPVYDATCTPRVIASQSAARTCQCYKLLRTYGVYDFRDWLQTSATHSIDYTWSMDGCSVEYEPLIVAAKVNVGLIAGCASAGGVVVVMGMVYLACCMGRRNNRSAPKDPNEPFAMVFTDIQSSTSLWARAPEAMGEALDQHHTILRSLVSKYDGYEVKTIGDSFMVAFKLASDATSFGLAIQTSLFAATWEPDIDDVYVALASEAHEDKASMEDPKKAEERRKAEAGKLHQWEDANNYPLNWNGIRVRVGMHWGVGSIKLDPVSQGYDYYGTLVNTAARVEGVGNGGQVLATNDFFTQLEAEQFNMTDVDIKPLGPQPLRGLDAPVALYQLSPSSLRSREFADLRLDVEIALDTTESSNQTASSAPVDDTPLSMMARLLKRHKNSGPMYDYLTRVAQFMDTLLRTSPMSYRKDALKHYMKKWHVPLRKPKDSKEPIETSISFDLAALVVRVGLASEEAHQSAVSQGSHGKESTVGQPKRRRSNTSAHFTAVKSFGGAEEIDDGSDRPL